MNIFRLGSVIWILGVFAASSFAQRPSTPYAISYQVNVDTFGNNIVGDVANEPSLCIDPTNPNRIAVGWRQFGNVNDAFRQAGWAYSTNGGTSWTFPGSLEPNLFRSDPVLASDADGQFYYLGVLTNGPAGVNYHCDLFRSTNGGMTFRKVGEALGGDKEWMVIDRSTGPGRGNIYQAWSPFYNYANDSSKIFSRSTDGGQTWMNAVALPGFPYYGTLDIGINGEVYVVGSNGGSFTVNRSTNAPNRDVTPTFDLTTNVDLGGSLIFGSQAVNPEGLLGQPWIAVDRSTAATRGNVYVLCTVSGTGNPADVMFARSTDGGVTWSTPQRINDDSPDQNAYHWFGTMSVAPNGRVDVCWNDTRNDPSNIFSELYYSYSYDGGMTWSTNVAISPAFNHQLGYPVPQHKMGDYIGMISLNEAACIAYTATFNGEEDVYYIRLDTLQFEPPVVTAIATLDGTVHLAWNSVVGKNYCVQYSPDLAQPWSSGMTVGCLMATNDVSRMKDRSTGGTKQRFYRVVAEP